MKITFSFEGFVFKRVEFTRAFQEALRLEMRNAARAFAAEVILHVPVRTGFARGALLNLTDAIGINAASNPAAFRLKLSRRPGRNTPANGLTEYYTGHGGRVLKTPDNARPYSTPPAKVFTDDGREFHFNYAVTVLYYEINETNLGWHSFDHASEAFKDYLNRVGLSRLPAIKSYILKEKRS